MRVDLKVPYSDKEKAKRLGARWDAGRRTWYIENLENLSPFLQWMPSHLRKAHKPKEKSAPIQKSAWWDK